MLRYYCASSDDDDDDVEKNGEEKENDIDNEAIGLPTWIYEELRSIQEVSHRYGDEPTPEDLVESLAEELAPEFNLPSERLLDGNELLFEYNPSLIKVRHTPYYCCYYYHYTVLFHLFVCFFFAIERKRKKTKNT